MPSHNGKMSSPHRMTKNWGTKKIKILDDKFIEKTRNLWSFGCGKNETCRKNQDFDFTKCALVWRAVYLQCSSISTKCCGQWECPVVQNREPSWPQVGAVYPGSVRIMNPVESSWNRLSTSLSIKHSYPVNYTNQNTPKSGRNIGYWYETNNIVIH